ncbi:MAG: hypothetical protein IJ806_11230 [Ruminococcus sp.]|nr:hypothetical protein [Ruminococcus sp.]
MKKVISSILGIIFVVIIVCGVFVGTYVFSTPTHDKGTDSRQFVLGYWTDEEKDLRLVFGESGEFTITKESDTSHSYAKGYFKIDEDNKRIKLLVLPNDTRDTTLDLGEKLKFFSTITYADLEYDEPYADVGWTMMSNNQRKAVMAASAEVKLIVQNTDGNIFRCTRTRTVEQFNDGKEHN